MIRRATEAKISIVVAVNKMDLQGTDLKKVQVDLAHHGLLARDMGGDVEYCGISALKKQGLDDLLDVILKKAGSLNLRGNPKVRASGTVIESKVEKGRGSVGNGLDQEWDLRDRGSVCLWGVLGDGFERCLDESGHAVRHVGPSRAVEVIGFDGSVAAGDRLQVLSSDREAKRVAEVRQQLDHKRRASKVKKVTLSNLFDTIKERKVEEL